MFSDEDIDIDIEMGLNSIKNVHPLERQSDAQNQPPAKRKKCDQESTDQQNYCD
ncbi:hypothetical protein Pst134EB_028792 [Puccinia striiformis f. sp. tritici]|nr:hypothetical protein Pst134EB_028792 [Puccinia striiformis f. sp. tritici]